MDYQITHATEADISAVAAFAAEVFAEYFGHLYRPENLALHIAATCSPDYFRKTLASGETLLLLKSDDRLIGYAKLGHVTLPLPKPPAAGALEIHRVYIDQDFRDQGLGKLLVMHLLGLPQVQVAPAVYLGVWEENVRAQALYAQYGFKPIGHYLYKVGDQSDREMIMWREGLKLAKPKPRH